MSKAERINKTALDKHLSKADRLVHRAFQLQEINESSYKLISLEVINGKYSTGYRCSVCRTRFSEEEYTKIIVSCLELNYSFRFCLDEDSCLFRGSVRT